MLADIRGGKFPAPSKVDASVPLALEAVCLKAMSLQMADRYASAAALAEELEFWLADEPVSAYRESWMTRLSRWSKRHRAFVASGLGMLIVSTFKSLMVELSVLI